VSNRPRQLQQEEKVAIPTLVEAVDGRVFVDHYFYVINPDNDVQEALPDPRDSPYESIDVGLDGAMVICYSGGGWVDVRVEFWHGEPERQTGWHDSVEVDLRSTTGDAQVWGAMGDEPEWKGEPVNVAHDGPGTYRLRLYRQGEEYHERHLIQSWRVG
jgi:hypothetical protein